MEMFGLLFAMPVTLVTSLVFCLLASFAFGRWPRVRSVSLLLATMIVGLLFIEVVLSLLIGPFYLHERFGGTYSIFHYIGFFLGPPAIAVLVLILASRFVRFKAVRIGFATLLCWFACMATLLANIAVDEDIHGIDGSGDRPESIFPP